MDSDFVFSAAIAALIVFLINFFIWVVCELIPYLKSCRNQKKQKEEIMLNRKELEDLLGRPLTDEQWEENAKIMSEIADRMWEEDHPMDE